MTSEKNRDPSLERAREEAEGTDVFEGPGGGSLEREREDAQGIEVFTDPDVTIRRSALVEGSPGHETLTGDAVGSVPDNETDREHNLP